jgi:hypothetical protein
MRFIIDTESKLVTVYGNPGLKELATELFELSDKGFEGYAVHVIPMVSASVGTTYGYVTNDTLTNNEGVPPIIHY